MIELAAVAITAVCLALMVPLLVQLAIGLFMPWPQPREHHAYRCVECSCSYESQALLVRHANAQHTDDAVFRLPCDGGPARG